MIHEKTKLVLRRLFTQAIEKCASSAQVYYDLIVSVDYSEGRLGIADDSDNLLAEEIIFDFVHREGQEVSEEEVRLLLQTLLHELHSEDAFARDCFGEPFSVSLVGEVETSELLYVHDDYLLLDKPLMAHLDEDLDTFFRDLFSE